MSDASDSDGVSTNLSFDTTTGFATTDDEAFDSHDEENSTSDDGGSSVDPAPTSDDEGGSEDKSNDNDKSEDEDASKSEDDKSGDDGLEDSQSFDARARPEIPSVYDPEEFNYDEEYEWLVSKFNSTLAQLRGEDSAFTDTPIIRDLEQFVEYFTAHADDIFPDDEFDVRQREEEAEAARLAAARAAAVKKAKSSSSSSSSNSDSDSDSEKEDADATATPDAATPAELAVNATEEAKKASADAREADPGFQALSSKYKELMKRIDRGRIEIREFVNRREDYSPNQPWLEYYDFYSDAYDTNSMVGEVQSHFETVRRRIKSYLTQDDYTILAHVVPEPSAAATPAATTPTPATPASPTDPATTTGTANVSVVAMDAPVPVETHGLFSRVKKKQAAHKKQLFPAPAAPPPAAPGAPPPPPAPPVIRSKEEIDAKLRENPFYVDEEYVDMLEVSISHLEDTYDPQIETCDSVIRFYQTRLEQYYADYSRSCTYLDVKLDREREIAERNKDKVVREATAVSAESDILEMSGNEDDRGAVDFKINFDGETEEEEDTYTDSDDSPNTGTDPNTDSNDSASTNPDTESGDQTNEDDDPSNQVIATLMKLKESPSAIAAPEAGGMGTEGEGEGGGMCPGWMPFCGAKPPAEEINYDDTPEDDEGWKRRFEDVAWIQRLYWEQYDFDYAYSRLLGQANEMIERRARYITAMKDTVEQIDSAWRTAFVPAKEVKVEDNDEARKARHAAKRERVRKELQAELDEKREAYLKKKKKKKKKKGKGSSDSDSDSDSDSWGSDSSLESISSDFSVSYSSEEDDMGKTKAANVVNKLEVYLDSVADPNGYFKMRLKWKEDETDAFKESFEYSSIQMAFEIKTRQLNLMRMRRRAARDYVEHYRKEEASSHEPLSDEIRGNLAQMETVVSNLESKIAECEQEVTKTLKKWYDKDLPDEDDTPYFLGASYTDLAMYIDNIESLPADLLSEFVFIGNVLLSQATDNRLRHEARYELFVLHSLENRRAAKAVKARLAYERKREEAALAELGTKQQQMTELIDEVEIMLFLEQIKKFDSPLEREAINELVARLEKYRREMAVGLKSAYRKTEDNLANQLGASHHDFCKFVKRLRRDKEKLAEINDVKKLRVATRAVERKQLMLISKLRQYETKSKKILEALIEAESNVLGVSIKRHEHRDRFVNSLTNAIDEFLGDSWSSYGRNLGTFITEMEQKVNSTKALLESATERAKQAKRRLSKKDYADDDEKAELKRLRDTEKAKVAEFTETLAKAESEWERAKLIKAKLIEIKGKESYYNDNGQPSGLYKKKQSIQAKITRKSAERDARLAELRSGKDEAPAVEDDVEFSWDDIEYRWSMFNPDRRKLSYKALHEQTTAFSLSVNELLSRDVWQRYEELKAAESDGMCSCLPCVGKKNDDEEDEENKVRKLEGINMDRVIVYSALLAATCVILYFSFWASTDTSTYDIAKADVGPDATITFDIESCDLTFVACDADIRPPWLTFANIQADCDKYQVLATRNVDTLEVDDKKHSVTVTNPATEIEHAEEDEEIPDRSVCRILVSVPDNKGVSADERPAIAIKASGVYVDVMGDLDLGDNSLSVTATNKSDVEVNIEFGKLTAGSANMRFAKGLVEVGRWKVAGNSTLSVGSGDVVLTAPVATQFNLYAGQPRYSCFGGFDGANNTYDSSSGSSSSTTSSSSSSSTNSSSSTSGEWELGDPIVWTLFGSQSEADDYAAAQASATSSSTTTEGIQTVRIATTGVVSANVVDKSGDIRDGHTFGNFSQLDLFTAAEEDEIRAKILPDLSEGSFNETYLVFRTRGPAAPVGTWFYSSHRRYIAFTPDLVQILSGGLLTPLTSTGSYTLRTGMCQWDGATSTHDDSASEKRGASKRANNPGLPEAFVEILHAFDDIRPGSEFSFATDESCITVFTEDKSNLGSYRTSCLEFFKEGDITVVATMTVVVSALLSLSCLYACIFSVMRNRLDRYRHGLVSNHKFYVRKYEERVVYRQEEEKLRKWIGTHTTPFFMVELLFPNEEPADPKVDTVIAAEVNHSKAVEYVVVLTHLLMVLTPVLPLLLGIVYYHRINADLQLNDRFREDMLSVLFFICVAYVLFATLHLFSYYLTVNTSKFERDVEEDDEDVAAGKKKKSGAAAAAPRLPCFSPEVEDEDSDDAEADLDVDERKEVAKVSYLARAYTYSYAIVVLLVLFLSLLFINSLVLWVILGIFVNPNAAIPVAVGIGSVVGHVVTLNKRLFKNLSRVIRKLEAKVWEVLSNMNIAAALGDLVSLAEGAALSAFAAKRLADVGVSPTKFEKSMKDGFIPVAFARKMREQGVPTDQLRCTVTGALDVWYAIQNNQIQSVPGLDNELKNVGISAVDLHYAAQSGFVDPMLSAFLEQININLAVLNGKFFEMLSRKPSQRSDLFNERAALLLGMQNLEGLSAKLREGFVPFRLKERVLARGVPTHMLDSQVLVRIQLDDFIPQRIEKQLVAKNIDVNKLKFYIRNDMVPTDMRRDLKKAGIKLDELIEDIENALPAELAKLMTRRHIPPALLSQYLTAGYVPYEYHDALRNDFKMETCVLSRNVINNIRAGYAVPNDIDRTLRRVNPSCMQRGDWEYEYAAERLSGYILSGYVPLPLIEEMAKLGVFFGAFYRTEPLAQLAFPGWDLFNQDNTSFYYYKTHHFDVVAADLKDRIFRTYGVGKLQSEDLVEDAERRGIDLRVFRPSRLYGGWFGQLRIGYTDLPFEFYGNEFRPRIKHLPRTDLVQCTRMGMFPHDTSREWRDDVKRLRVKFDEKLKQLDSVTPEDLSRFRPPYLHEITGDVLDKEHPIGKEFIEFLAAWSPIRRSRAAKAKASADTAAGVGPGSTTATAATAETAEEVASKAGYLPETSEHGFVRLCERLIADDLDVNLTDLREFLIGEAVVDAVATRVASSKTERTKSHKRKKKESEDDEDDESGDDDDEEESESEESYSEEVDKKIKSTASTVTTSRKTKVREQRLLVPYSLLRKLEKAGINTIRLQERFFREIQAFGEEQFQHDYLLVDAFESAGIKFEELQDQLRLGEVSATMISKLRLAGINPYVVSPNAPALNQIRANYFTPIVLDKLKSAKLYDTAAVHRAVRLIPRSNGPPTVNPDLDSAEMMDAWDILDSMDLYISTKPIKGSLTEYSSNYSIKKVAGAATSATDAAADANANRNNEEDEVAVVEDNRPRVEGSRTVGVFADPERALRSGGAAEERGAVVDDDDDDDTEQKLAVDAMVREVVDRVLGRFGVSARNLAVMLIVSTLLLLLILVFLFIGISAFSTGSPVNTAINSVMVLGAAGGVNSSQRPEEDESKEDEYVAYIEEDIDEVM